ncbi:hypothetical protein RvY_04582-2 [Ramazzottius varieornatus]|uniref:Uncharacterized protein n=1 Tax=Ramazzottius varieornatus TaxID=947166 RepID=A0A1D1UVF4_RAMVA|nr:hypothetical protein RvY_04582-2 [Ramazzottius varieornatus]
MEPLLELIHVVSLPLGFSQRNLVHRFANHRSLGTKTALAIVARNGTGLTAQQAQDASVRSFLQAVGLCRVEVQCSGGNCRRCLMRISWVDGDLFAFVCTSCNATKFMFKGTFL